MECAKWPTNQNPHRSFLQGNLPNPGIASGSPAVQADSLLSNNLGEFVYVHIYTPTFMYIHKEKVKADVAEY